MCRYPYRGPNMNWSFRSGGTRGLILPPYGAVPLTKISSQRKKKTGDQQQCMGSRRVRFNQRNHAEWEELNPLQPSQANQARGDPFGILKTWGNTLLWISNTVLPVLTLTLYCAQASKKFFCYAWILVRFRKRKDGGKQK